MRCTICNTVIPHHAKYCPKCGLKAGLPAHTKPPLAPNAHPAKAPMPRSGKVFLGTAAIAVTFLGLGLANRVPFFWIAGAALLALLIVTLVLGDLLS